MPPLQEKIFGLSIFLFAQNLWLTQMKNGSLTQYNKVTLTFGEVSLKAYNKASLLKGRFGGFVNISGGS